RQTRPADCPPGQAKREKIGASICTIPDKASPFRDDGGRDPLARPESATLALRAPEKISFQLR
ncbi:MAG: hypothetical protein WCF79_03460, partial [Rhodomicrobium sp.]